MKQHIKPRLLWLVLIGILLAACQEPTATDLTNQFFEQQQKYEEVYQIIYDAISTSPPSLPPTTELIKELGIRSMYWSDGCNIYFMPFQSRKNGIGIKKGFAALCEPPTELVDDIDQVGDRQGFYVVYQHLADKWYLFREVYPTP